MKSVVRFLCVAAAWAGSAASAAPLLDLSHAAYHTYGNANTYSLPGNALFASLIAGAPAGAGNPYYVSTAPSGIQDLVVVYTGSSVPEVIGNQAGFDDAYRAPGGTSPTYSSIDGSVNMLDPGNKSGIAHNDAQTWDASLLALKSFLGGQSLIFLISNDETSIDATLAIWAKLWVTNPSSGVYQNRYLYLSNTGTPYGTGAVDYGDASLYDPGNVTHPATGYGATDFVASGGTALIDLPGRAPIFVSHNLGADVAAFAGTVPVLNDWFSTLFRLPDAQLQNYTLHFDLRMGCESPGDWSGRCNYVQADGGYEQLVLAPALLANELPEPADAALTAFAFLALGAVRLRRR